MAQKEATARIKINRLLESAGWRFFAEDGKPANVRLEPTVALKRDDLDALGDDFQKTKKGSIDFLLLDDRGFPQVVLEAKAEHKDPLAAKEQARKYARSQNCRFVILSNGNLHFLWDLERGNPEVISAFPSPGSLGERARFVPDRNQLVNAEVADDYIALSQHPSFRSDAGWTNLGERPAYVKANKLAFMRPYQVRAVHQLQAAVAEGKDRFLFEMATGTGKTLTAAAVIKLFLRTKNASRVLFLVDRLELESQALKAFKVLLSKDFDAVIYKESRDEWNKAEVVVTTVQSLLFDNKYQRLFSPTDFDLVISDEAHRSIGGNARAVFDYFVGYKPPHANGHVFYSTERALAVKIHEILRVVDEIQVHSKPVVERCYRDFLSRSADPEIREYPAPEDQIREVLVHANYLSSKDIELCLRFDVSALRQHRGFDEIGVLHGTLARRYRPDS